MECFSTLHSLSFPFYMIDGRFCQGVKALVRADLELRLGLIFPFSVNPAHLEIFSPFLR